VTAADVWRRGQVGWPRRFPIAQFPNPSLLLALAGSVLAAVSSGTVHDVGRVVSTAALAFWACQEMASGVNWFRRAFGLAVFTWVLLRVTGAS
jgi:hypothetical protein